jgi:hypothetical protein
MGLVVGGAEKDGSEICEKLGKKDPAGPSPYKQTEFGWSLEQQ